MLQRILERERIDDGGQHAHVSPVTRSICLSGRGHAAKDIAAPENQSNLDTSARHFRHFTRRETFTRSGIQTKCFGPASASPLILSRIRLNCGSRFNVPWIGRTAEA